MIYAILLMIFSIAGFLVGFGDGGRGRYSRWVSAAGGFVWLGGVIYAFYLNGAWFGLGSIAASFVIAASTMNVGKSVATSARQP